MSPPLAEPVFPQFVGAPRRHPKFVGRDQELQSLANRAATEPGTVVCAVGTGGIGKTALAVEHAYRQEASGTDVVRWITGPTREGIEDQYTRVAPAIGVSTSGLGIDDQIARVRHWFESTEKSWLLVLDGIDKPKDIEDLLPRRGNGQVVVTTRHQDWDDHLDAAIVPIGLLPKADAIRLLESDGSKSPGADGAEALVERLEYLPLAIEQAGVFCHRTGWTYATYIAEFERRTRDIMSRQSAGRYTRSGHDLAMTAVWETSVEQADLEASGARQLLAVLSHLGPRQVPRVILSGDHLADEPVLFNGDHLVVDEAIAALERFSVVTTERASDRRILTVSTHSLIQAIARTDPSAGQSEFEAAARTVASVYPSAAGEPESWPVCQILDSHVAAIAHHAANHENLAGVGWLLDQRSSYLLSIGQSSAAVQASLQAATIAETIFGPTSPEALGSLSHLGNAYLEAGQITEAVRTAEQVLRDTEATLGADHRSTVMSLGNLASTYGAAGRYNEAIEIETRVLSWCEANLEKNDPDEISSRSNVGSSLYLSGRPEEAVPFYERALAQAEARFGHRHIETVHARGRLAACYRDAGMTDEAIQLQESVTSQYVELVGADHIFAVQAAGELASCHAAAGRIDDALDTQETTTTRLESDLGPNHPSVIAARANLGLLYERMNRFGDSVQQLLTTVIRFGESLGHDHPHTLRARTDLAHTYERAGIPGFAIVILSQVTEDIEDVFGTDHRRTVDSLLQLARTYRNSGDFVSAIPAQERAVASRTRSLGNEHPDSLSARGELAAFYGEVGRFEESLVALEEVARLMESTLGQDAEETVRTLGNLAFTYWKAGRTEAALLLQERVLQLSQRTFGFDSADAGRATNNLALFRAGSAADLQQGLDRGG